jgi:amino acid transporter
MAKILSIGLIFVVFILGISFLNIPLVYKLTTNNPLILYKGYLLIALSLVLVWKYKWLENKLVWAVEKVHRALSSILIIIALGIDGLMHIFNIPHMEGWWISIIAGSTFLTWLTAGFCSHFAKKTCNEKPSLEKVTKCIHFEDKPKI